MYEEEYKWYVDGELVHVGKTFDAPTTNSEVTMVMVIRNPDVQVNWEHHDE